jgi:hypothetical protein
MNATNQFLLELTLVWGILFICYAVVFRSRTDWPLQRRYLWTALAAGLLIPLLPDFPLSLPATAVTEGWNTLRLPPQTGDLNLPVSSPSIPTSATIWLIGSVVTLSIMVFRTARHLSRGIAGRPTHENFGGYPVVRSEQVSSPYAAWRKIYLPVGLDPDLERTALLHEAAHLDRGHDYERLLLSLLLSVFWFHPLLWLIARRITIIQEFEADRAVLQHLPRQTYGRQLIQSTLAPRLVAGLFSSPLKRRIAMLLHTTDSRPVRRRVYLLFFVLLGGLIVACANPAALTAQDTAVYTLYDTQNEEAAPQLKEGQLVRYIYESIRYPAMLRENGLTGAVSVEIALLASGQVDGFSIVKLKAKEKVNDQNAVVVTGFGGEKGEGTFSMNTLFMEEVQRILQDLPEFRPATKNGKAIPSIIRFDVVFNLT